MQKPEEKYWKSNELILCRIDIREEENINDFSERDFLIYISFKVESDTNIGAALQFGISGQTWS